VIEKENKGRGRESFVFPLAPPKEGENQKGTTRRKSMASSLRKKKKEREDTS